ncbi:MAG: acyltransferase 3 [Verrucomicrobia bacterium]|nr:acyltransferase 3 [Verrucomicrobiota bacterium]
MWHSPGPQNSGPMASAEKRVFGLDLLRAVAITLVLVQHAAELLVQVPEEWRCWIHFGRFGVDLFFALSGFLVGGILLRAGPALLQPRLLGGFLVGRWMRTLPLFYFMLALRACLRAAADRAPADPWRVLGSYAVFTQNLAWPMPAFFVESWSLSVEEWFYVLLPLLIWAGLRGGLRGPRALWAGAVILLTVPLLMRCLVSNAGDQGLDLIGIVVYRLDSIAWGVVGAILAHLRPKWWQSIRAPALAIGLLVLGVNYAFAGAAPWGAPFARTFLLSFQGLGMALLLPWASMVRAFGGDWWRRSVQYVAQLSYSIYLTHLLVAGTLYVHLAYPHPRAGMPERAAWVALFVSITLAISATTYRWIEQPALAARNRIRAYLAFKAALRG